MRVAASPPACFSQHTMHSYAWQAPAQKMACPNLILYLTNILSIYNLIKMIPYSTFRVSIFMIFVRLCLCNRPAKALHKATSSEASSFASHIFQSLKPIHTMATGEIAHRNLKVSLSIGITARDLL